jgi:uncharacterized Zn-binding protein involved in type VI secretion
MRYEGRSVALKGDLVTCPVHPDINPNAILEGDGNITDVGVPIARHGHPANCGCHPISSLV